MNACDSVAPDLPALITGELDETGRGATRGHLADVPDAGAI